jgi:glycosyltransferase involved in cell wall biosynthesis
VQGKVSGPIRIVTNFMQCPTELRLDGAPAATVTRAATWPELRRAIPTADLIVIDCQGFLIYRAAAYFAFRLWKRTPLVAVDLLFRIPKTFRHKATALAKRLLLARVTHFIHYFTDWTGYERHFRISRGKSSYVAFKSNIWGKNTDTLPLAESYVFTMGVSLRDYDTFIRAIAGQPYPAAIPAFSLQHFEGRDGSFAWRPDSLPGNLTVLPDSGDHDDLLRNMARAKMVVIPTRKESLCASGISTYLDAMYLGKCVIISDGPGASDVLSTQAVLVPPEDPAALRSAIERMWTDDEARRQVAAAGHEYAVGLGGEEALMRRIFTQSMRAAGLLS